MKDSRAGVSIVEVSLAFLILGLTMLPIIELFSSTSREAENSADHTLSLAISNKVAEEMRIASWENPHYYDGVDADPSFGGEKSIVNGSSPFLATIEDNAGAPGRILPEEDTGITPSSGQLFTDLKDFKLSVYATGSQPPPPGSPVDVAVEVSWTDFRGKPMKSELKAVLPRLVQSGGQPIVDRARADALIAKQFYDAPDTRTLTQIAAERGANLDVLRAFGDVVVIAIGLEVTEAEHQRDLGILDTAATGATGATKARFLQLLGHQLEQRASSRMMAIEYLASKVETLGATFDIATLGSPPPPPARWVEGFRLAAYIPLDFDWDLSDALAVYQTALTVPADAMSPRQRTLLLVRMARIAQLMALTSGPDDLSYVKEILQAIQSLQRGRNPQFESFARQELARSSDINLLRGSYARPMRLFAWDSFTGVIGETITKVLATAPGAAIATGTVDPTAPGTAGQGGSFSNGAAVATAPAGDAAAAAATTPDAAARKGSRAILAAANTSATLKAGLNAADAAAATAAGDLATPPPEPAPAAP